MKNLLHHMLRCTLITILQDLLLQHTVISVIEMVHLEFVLALSDTVNRVTSNAPLAKQLIVWIVQFPVRNACACTAVHAQSPSKSN